MEYCWIYLSTVRIAIEFALHTVGAHNESRLGHGILYGNVSSPVSSHGRRPERLAPDYRLQRKKKKEKNSSHIINKGPVQPMVTR